MFPGEGRSHPLIPKRDNGHLSLVFARPNRFHQSLMRTQRRTPYMGTDFRGLVDREKLDPG
jgi:hypothetical protein